MRRTYRTRLLLRVAVDAAALFWAAILVFLARLPHVGPGTVLSASAFLTFFVVFSAVYERAAITVTPGGFLVSGLFRRFPVRFEEVLRIEVRRGLAGTFYEVRTERGRVGFSSLFARHGELLELLLDRCSLAPT